MARLRKSPGRASGFLLGTAVLLALVVSIGALALAFLNPFATETVDRSGPAVIEQIRELEEFTAAEAEFVQDVDLESDTKWVPAAIRGERVVAMASGTVRSTVDFSGLDADAVSVSDDGSSISVQLPEPVLQDAEVSEEGTRIVSRQRGILDRLGDLVSANPFDDRELYASAAEKLEQAAAASDIDTTARENTEEWLEAFLGAAGFDEVVVNWSQAPV